MEAHERDCIQILYFNHASDPDCTALFCIHKHTKKLHLTEFTCVVFMVIALKMQLLSTHEPGVLTQEWVTLGEDGLIPE